MFGHVPKTGEISAKNKIKEVNELMEHLNVFHCTVGEANGYGLVGLGLIPESR
jgi:hypothetical protein